MPYRKLILAALLLLLGVELFLVLDPSLVRPMRAVMLYLAAIGLAFAPPVQRAIARVSAFFDRRRAPRTAASFLVLCAASTAWLYTCAISEHRVFGPSLHDEFSYRIQTQILARGHLWMPAHPLADAFDTFYVITDRVYASQYFPGAAAMSVPAVWLHVSFCGWALLLAGITCATLWLLVRELFDSATGFAAAVLLLANPAFRFLSLATLSQVPAMLLVMWAWIALIRWRGARELTPQRARRWIVVAGAAMGWLLITRPLDAIAFGATGAVYVVWELRRADRSAWLRTAVAGAMPITPFIALQLIANVGITGHLFQTPFDYYLRRDMPGTQLGFHGVDPSLHPVSPLQQKQDFYDSFVHGMLQSHTLHNALVQWGGERSRNLLKASLPDLLVVIVLPLGLLTLRGRDRWLLVGSIPVWCIAYSLHPFDLWHYGVILAPCATVIVLHGLSSIARERAALSLRVLLPVAIGCLAMPQMRRDVKDQMLENSVEERLSAAIANEIREPQAIVLVRYAPERKIDSALEVVYNTDVAWPDDAPVIRAHDLGADRNAALYRYYAQRQPDRMVYRFDRATNALVRLGNVVDLAYRASTQPTTVP